MTARRVLPHGAWPSPITAASLVAGSVRVGEVRVDGDDVWWSEQRPTEGGRTQVVRRTPDGTCHDLFPPPDPDAGVRAWDARSRAGEYGGGAWAVDRGIVVFVDGADQRIHRVEPGAAPEPLAGASEPSVRFGHRYRDLTSWDDDWIICERETHEPDVV
ncbi:MAG: hypothetical protein KDA97_03490, partial [Acidimicrobiales bacterium]|nr:hypothetical protein [Acidimicrobiales bacterium]